MVNTRNVSNLRTFQRDKKINFTKLNNTQVKRRDNSISNERPQIRFHTENTLMDEFVNDYNSFENTTKLVSILQSPRTKERSKFNKSV